MLLTGTPIPTRTSHPAIDNASTRAGNTKNIMTKYMSANHRYLAVVLPKNFAPLMGTFLINGIGYQTAIPEILKNRWQSAICKDSRNFEVAARAARIEVIVVPIFAPSVRG